MNKKKGEYYLERSFIKSNPNITMNNASQILFAFECVTDIPVFSKYIESAQDAPFFSDLLAAMDKQQDTNGFITLASVGENSEIGEYMDYVYSTINTITVQSDDDIYRVTVVPNRVIPDNNNKLVIVDKNNDGIHIRIAGDGVLSHIEAEQIRDKVKNNPPNKFPVEIALGGVKGLDAFIVIERGNQPGLSAVHFDIDCTLMQVTAGAVFVVADESDKHRVQTRYDA